MGKNTIRPRGVTTIVVVNSIAALLTVAFWGLVCVRLFAQQTPPAELDRGSLATAFGFMIGDLIWATLLLLLSVVGLWRLRSWGWLAAQMANILWIYSMTVVWSRDFYATTMSPGGILFLPFVPFSVWATFYLWNCRELFFQATANGR